MFTTHRPRQILTAVLASAALLTGAACGSETASSDASGPGAEQLPSATADTASPTTVVPSTPAPERTSTDAPVPTTPATTTTTTTTPPTTVVPTTVPATTAPPTTAPSTTMPPAPAPSWDGACGPNEPVPGDATDITSTAVGVAEFGTDGIVSAYRSGGAWYLRYDSAVISDEMLLDVAPDASVRVLTAIDLSGGGDHEVLVTTGARGPVTELGLIGQHDGCLFQYRDTENTPVVFDVGVEGDTFHGVTCRNDEYGSFLIERSAVPNGDDTWNIYATSYQAGTPLRLDAGDGGHEFAVPGDDPVFSTFAGVECGDVEPGDV